MNAFFMFLDYTNNFPILTNATKLHILRVVNMNIVKKTPARSAITEFLSKTETPVDIEQIINFLRVKNLNTNKVTVYRIMDFFYKNGIVDRLEFQEGKFRYEIRKVNH